MSSVLRQCGLLDIPEDARSVIYSYITFLEDLRRLLMVCKTVRAGLPDAVTRIRGFRDDSRDRYLSRECINWISGLKNLRHLNLRRCHSSRSVTEEQFMVLTKYPLRSVANIPIRLLPSFILIYRMKHSTLPLIACNKSVNLDSHGTLTCIKGNHVGVSSEISHTGEIIVESQRLASVTIDDCMRPRLYQMILHRKIPCKLVISSYDDPSHFERCILAMPDTDCIKVVDGADYISLPDRICTGVEEMYLCLNSSILLSIKEKFPKVRRFVFRPLPYSASQVEETDRLIERFLEQSVEFLMVRILPPTSAPQNHDREYLEHIVVRMKIGATIDPKYRNRIGFCGLWLRYSGSETFKKYYKELPMEHYRDRIEKIETRLKTLPPD